MLMLSDAQIERYSRQILLPEIGGRGQERLLAARVAIVGASDCAATAATYLAAAGVGELLLTDALPGIDRLNEDCRVEIVEPSISSPAWASLVSGGSLIVACDIDLATLAALQSLAIRSARALLWGADSGVFAVLHEHDRPAESPCLSCLLEVATPDCLTALAAPRVFWVGTQLASAAVALLNGQRAASCGDIWRFDPAQMSVDARRAPSSLCRHSPAPVDAATPQGRTP